MNNNQLLLSKKGQEFQVNSAITCKFDGSTLRIYFQGVEYTKPYEAHIGDVFYVYPSGKSKTPRVTKDKAKNRGHLIARLMSFGSEKQYNSTEKEFMLHTQLVKQDPNVSNIRIEHKERVYGFIIADVVHYSDRIQAKGLEPRKKENSPLRAWISDDISKSDLAELLDLFSTYHCLHAPREFIMLQ